LAQHDRYVLTKAFVARERRETSDAVLKCAVSNGLVTLDTFGRLSAEPTARDLFGTYHMNARGNAIVAHQLAAAMPALLADRRSP
jgi:hypothetical protein